MHKQNLLDLFSDCDPVLREMIEQVLILEQEYISFERPRIKDDLDHIISSSATKQLRQSGENLGQELP